MKNLLITAVVCMCVGLTVAQEKSKLTEVRRIYLGDLRNEEGSDLVREKIRVRLMKSDRFSVVETVEAADAILTGVAGVERHYHSSVSGNTSTGQVSGSGGTSYAGVGVLRLVDVKSQETIWVFEYKRRFGFGSASSRVADKTVERLIKNAKTADKAEKSSPKQ